jgi:hypothetical protein
MEAAMVARRAGGDSDSLSGSLACQLGYSGGDLVFPLAVSGRIELNDVDRRILWK